MDPVDQFISKMLDDSQSASLKNIQGDVRAQLQSDLRQRLLDRIDRAVLEAVPDRYMDELEQLVSNPHSAPEDIQRFITRTGVDDQKISAEVMLEFRKLYVKE